MLRSLQRRRLFGPLSDIAPRSKSQLRQDLWVLAETGRKRGGFFVEIGAFDGVTHSNTYLLEKEFGWTGILVEPNPQYHSVLRETRAAALSTKAIYSGRSTTSFVCAREGVLSSIAQHAYDDRHADRRRDADTISVDTITLDDLLTEHGAPNGIDYLSIDTEGSELEILRGVDFNRTIVDLISVEHNYTPREQQIERLLRGAGYKRVYRRLSRFDAWYRRG
jgi:FkbM family methyltransferase